MDLIKINRTENGMKVDGRELHGFLQVGRDFTTWIKSRIEQFSFVEGEDFSPVLVKTSDGGRPRTEYDLTIDMAKELSMVENNDQGRKARKYFIECEKKLKQQPNNIQSMTKAEMLAAIAQQAVEQERRVNQIEQRLIETEKKQDGITEILSLNPTDWRKKVNAIINKIAKARGGHEAYQDVRNESYTKLEERAKCQLSIRLTNKKQKMALEGVPKSKIDKVTKMDVIADDARLTEIYLAIVKEMAIHYQVDVSDLKDQSES